MDFRENCIEWLTGQTTCTITLSQSKYINKVKRLAEKNPKEVKILHTNKDGSIVAKLPLSAIKINIISRSKTDKKVDKEIDLE